MNNPVTIILILLVAAVVATAITFVNTKKGAWINQHDSIRAGTAQWPGANWHQNAAGSRFCIHCGGEIIPPPPAQYRMYYQ